MSTARPARTERIPGGLSLQPIPPSTASPARTPAPAASLLPLDPHSITPRARKTAPILPIRDRTKAESNRHPRRSVHGQILAERLAPSRAERQSEFGARHLPHHDQATTDSDGGDPAYGTRPATSPLIPKVIVRPARDLWKRTVPRSTERRERSGADLFEQSRLARFAFAG